MGQTNDKSESTQDDNIYITPSILGTNETLNPETNDNLEQRTNDILKPLGTGVYHFSKSNSEENHYNQFKQKNSEPSPWSSKDKKDKDLNTEIVKPKDEISSGDEDVQGKDGQREFWAEYPSDLRNYKLSEIQDLCHEYKISIISHNRWELIGRLLRRFPREVVTETDLEKFSEVQLSNMCTGAYISNRGSKQELIKRLIKLLDNDPGQLATPAKPEDYQKHKVTVMDKTEPISKKRKTPEENSEIPENSDNRPQKRRKFLNPEMFREMAPSLPITIENHYYEVPPLIGEDKSCGWHKEGKQKIKVGGVNYNVTWRLNMTVLPLGEEVYENFSPLVIHEKIL